MVLNQVSIAGAFQAATADILDGLRLRSAWVELAKEDIGDQHRMTLLGPLWLLINYLAFAGTFIFVFNQASFGDSYGAYVATGLLAWFYMMETISQSVSLFSREEAYIKGTTLPLSAYALRLVTQSIIRSGYALAGCVALVMISGVPITPAWIWSLLGVLLLIAVTPPVVMLCAFVGAYFPDSRYIIANAMRIGMFLTPVFWRYEQSHGAQHLFYYWNPFTYFVEIVRAPIVSGAFPAFAFAISAAIGAILWILALFVLGSYRKHVVFVL